MEKAIFAGGCFWGMEGLIRRKTGVIKTRVGYTGGLSDHPKYESVKTGTTGHAEAIEISFDPALTSFDALLEIFFQIHDPTTMDRQGNDRGTQYRSAIFYLNDAQREAAFGMIERIERSGIWPGAIVTEVTKASTFWEAEDFHQDYLERNPNGYTCHFPRMDWVLPKG